ncbi:MAG: CFI-box-CTERM domain-containing protein [Kofleriaceae bacterium]
MRRFVWVALLVPALAHADDQRCVDVQFTPADGLQLVAWIESATGEYLDTIYVTQQIGSFGLGNRPGRYDFNSGPMWPYGRRTTTFPVWSHRHGLTFPAVVFQNDVSDDPAYCFGVSGPEYVSCGENDLSHPFDQSSHEPHFCRPRMPGEAGWDVGTCATTAYTDKGKFSTTVTSLYPPRADLTRAASDAPSVAMFKTLDPFDAVSQPTPAGGQRSHAPWPVPRDLPPGNYVIWIEAAQEYDFNATYNDVTYPPPAAIAWSTYGQPFRGQPSIVYRVPFAIAAAPTSSTISSYAGYGDPDGKDGIVRPPDDTITIDTPSSGAQRLELVSDAGDMYRVRVATILKPVAELPGAPEQLAAVDAQPTALTLSFVAPSIGAARTPVTGYDVRVRVGEPITDENFEDSAPVATQVTAGQPGAYETFTIPGLLPETDYWVGIRAYDDCRNVGELAVRKITTAARTAGAVDACFVATAAYGSVMANDVELLRHFRDSFLQTTALGELGVEAYYTFGPAVAGVVGESDLLRALARDLLAPIVTRVRALRF